MSAAATATSSCTAAHDHGKHFKVRVFLDVDNTLYTYEESNFHHEMHANLGRIVSEVLPGIEEKDALALCHDYHTRYGLTLAGLARHHHSEEKPVDLRKHCRTSNSCDYSVLKNNAEVVAMLEAMKNEDGYDLWLFTNADEPHAISCVEGVGIKHLFHEEDGYFKCVDCLDQWGASPLTEITNKPFPEAYKVAEDKAQNRMTINTEFVRVMVDDALVNLDAPNKMGWVSVWVSHGRDLPADTDIKPTLIIRRVEELRDALKTVFAKDE